MTCREKLKLEHPECVDPIYGGGCEGCPSSYGYLSSPFVCGGRDDECTECWDREIPGTEPLTYEHAGKPIGKVFSFTESENGVDIKIELIEEKEKNMGTKNTKKTKAELMEELENVKASKEELEKELKNLEKYKHYDDMAGEVHAIYMSFVNAGFSEVQAYDLLKTMINNASNITFNTTTTPPKYRSYR